MSNMSSGLLTFLRWLDTVFQGQCLPSLSINYVAINKGLKKFPPQLATVILDKNENLLWSGLQRHWSCHSNGTTPLPILLTALGTVLPKSFVEAFSSNSHLNVREVWVECSPYFTALQYENNLETQRSPKATLNLGNFNFSKKSFKWFKNYLLICKVDWNVYKTINKTVADPDLQFREGEGGVGGSQKNLFSDLCLA